MLRIFVPNERSARDILSQELVEALWAQGLSASLSDLWPHRLYRAMNAGRVPYGRTIFRRFMADLLASRRWRVCGKADIIWILSFCAPCMDQPKSESRIKQRAAGYIFHVMDDWFIFEWLAEGTMRRCSLADLVVVPTPQLADRVRQFVPDAKIEVLEEPVSTKRLVPQAPEKLSDRPVILWNGNPFNLENIDSISSILRNVHARNPFTLRVICENPPRMSLLEGLDVDWKAFDHGKERQLMEGCWFGIAPMADTGHNRCKGAYKVKTYYASGLPVVASSVGFQSDLVRGGPGTGLLAETPSEWAEALGRLLDDRNLCLSMGEKARAYAERRFSHQAVAPRWAQRLREHFGDSTFGNREPTEERNCRSCAA